MFGYPDIISARGNCEKQVEFCELDLCKYLGRY